MKYLLIICATIAVLACVVAYFLNSRLTIAEKKLSVLEAEKTALETEVKVYNEKSLQASKQIGELRKLIQKNKESDSDGYRCLAVAIPDDVLRMLYAE